MKPDGLSGPLGGEPWETARESVAAEGLRQRSAARATAVAEAVAAVAASEEHECGANSQLEALNLMLPRSMSIALGSGKLESSGSAEKINTQGEQATAGGPPDSSHVLHGYQALRAIRTRAHKFRTGYHNWRRHQAHGARGDIHDVFIEEDSPRANASLSNVSTEWNPIQARGTETAGILMSALKSSGSAHRDRRARRPGAPLPPTPVMADAEKYGIEVVHDDRVERPQWLRFFFNPHTPLQSDGVWPLRRDFLPKIAGALGSACGVPGCMQTYRGVYPTMQLCLFISQLLPVFPYVVLLKLLCVSALPLSCFVVEIFGRTKKWTAASLGPHWRLVLPCKTPISFEFVCNAARASVPQYSLDSSEIQCWIAHVGVGGFHRSHQCVFYDDLLAKTSAGFPDDLPEGVHKGPWAVCGIGILPGDKKMSDILHEQEFLYTVLTRSQRLCEARVIGSLMDFVFAPEEPKRLRGLLVDERTKMLSLTITEKGYCMATDGNLDKSLEPVKQDLKLLKKMVIQFATEIDVEMATWISKRVSLHSICLMQDSFCNDRPFFEAVGCLVVREVQSYEEMKLKLLNAGHSCVAYLATMLGYRFVDEAVRDVRVSGFLRSYMDEVTPCLQDLKVDVESVCMRTTRYKERIVERFGNAFVKDELQRVAQDGSSKFYSTTRSAVLELIERRKNVVKLSVALAAWILYFATDQVDGCRIDPCDPKRPFDLKPVGAFLNAVYGLPGEASRTLTRWVTMSLAALQMRGIPETLDAGGPLEALLNACFNDDEGWQSFVAFTQGLATT
ncbi:hypothetical protein ACSSS7_002298 [Eimeria intestinalis]